jgi:hypothetical protein
MNTNTIAKFTNLYAEVYQETSVEDYVKKLTTFFSTDIKEAPQPVAQVLATNTTGKFKSVFVGNTIKKITVDILTYPTMTYADITKSLVGSMISAGVKSTTVPEILETYKKLTNKTMFNTSALIYMNDNFKLLGYSGKTKLYSLV